MHWSADFVRYLTLEIYLFILEKAESKSGWIRQLNKHWNIIQWRSLANNNISDFTQHYYCQFPTHTDRSTLRTCFVCICFWLCWPVSYQVAFVYFYLFIYFLHVSLVYMTDGTRSCVWLRCVSHPCPYSNLSALFIAALSFQITHWFMKMPSCTL